MAEIIKGDSTYTGVIETEDGRIVCEKCQRADGEATQTMHIDFTDKYVTNYVCECDNAISVETKRDAESMMLWMDE